MRIGISRRQAGGQSADCPPILHVLQQGGFLALAEPFYAPALGDAELAHRLFGPHFAYPAHGGQRIGLGWRFTADEIAGGLASLVGYREDANWYLFANRSDATDEIGRLVGIELNRRRYTRGEVRAMLAQNKKLGYGVWLKS